MSFLVTKLMNLNVVVLCPSNEFKCCEGGDERASMKNMTWWNERFNLNRDKNTQRSVHITSLL